MFNRDRNQVARYQAPNAGQGGYAPWLNQNQPAEAGTGGVAVAREGYLTMSFFWMFLALLVSAGAAAFVLSNQTALQFVVDNFFILIIAELGLVFGISLGVNRIGAIPALGLLFVYALLNGATISLVVLGSIARTGGASGVLTAFLGASAIFGAAAIYGVVTKRDLTRLGGLLFMGLIGLIVVSLLNAFIFQGTTLDLLIGVGGVVIFTGLTAYHVQQLNSGQLGGVQTREGASVIGALLLYLNFVNLFLSLLRVFGGSRD